MRGKIQKVRKKIGDRENKIPHAILFYLEYILPHLPDKLPRLIVFADLSYRFTKWMFKKLDFEIAK